jgi:DNA-binding MarR family transcriptional regulator
MPYFLIREILDKLEAFEREGKSNDLRSFSFWLYSQFQDSPPGETTSLNHNLDGQLINLISILNSHIKRYTKAVLKDSPLVSLNDFSFLASLVEEGSMRKTDLIARNYSELSPGIEVIKRLLRNGLIEDFDNPEDGRSKQVRLTREGRKLYESMLDDMNRAARIMAGDLSEQEKLGLLALTHKLLAFHQPIWDQARGSDLEAIETQFLQSDQD